MSGLLCSLDVRMSYVDADGVPTGGYIGLINPVQVAVETPEPTRIQRISNLRDSQGQALDEVVRPNPTQIQLSTDELGDAEVLSWALNGMVGAYTQSAAMVTEAALAVVKGRWSKLPHRQVSALTVTPTGGGTAFVANVDYLLDPASGMILATTGGAIATGNVEVNYTAAALTGKAISGGTRASISVRIEGEGTNQATGQPIAIIVPRVNLSAAGALDLVGAEFLVGALSGTAIKVGSQDPVTVLYPGTGS